MMMQDNTQTYRPRQRNSGFSLIELSIVVAISGLITGVGALMYRSYQNDRYANESYEKLRVIESSLAVFIGNTNHLPCPSDPTIPITDPQAGREIPPAACQYLRGPDAVAGECLSNVCKVDGLRDTDNNGVPDPVLIGGLPFTALKENGTFNSVSTQGAIDPWGYQFTYAVSGYLTDPARYNASHGVIDVRTEPTTAAPTGVPLVEPEFSSQYVVVGHGKNHLGAYYAQGVQTTACTPGITRDADNCDRADASFTAGLYRETADANYFDDVLIYNSYSLSTLWDFVANQPDIYNRNPGAVGVGTSTPSQNLEVNGDISASRATVLSLCGKTRSGCWSPDLLAAPASSGLTLYCEPSGTAGMSDVVVGIRIDDTLTPPRPVAICAQVPIITPAVNQSCDPGHYVIGFDNTGTIVCN